METRHWIILLVLAFIVGFFSNGGWEEVKERSKQREKRRITGKQTKADKFWNALSNFIGNSIFNIIGLAFGCLIIVVVVRIIVTFF